MQKVKKAVVAVAGSGTRLLPATKAMPKEMLPIVDKPIIQLVVEELVEAGIEDIILVTKWDKKPLEDHFEHSWILEHELPGAQVDRYGIVSLKEGTMQINDIIEKPSIESAPSNLSDFGRMILNQEIIDVLKKTELGKGNELWIVDAIKKYIENGGEFYAKKVEGGEWLTTGDPLNYLKAILKYAMDREDLAGPIKEHFKTL